MLLVLFIPVLYVSALVHRCLQLYAPSNLLIKRTRAARARWRTAGALLILAVALIAISRGLTMAVAMGAWGGLNLIVLVLVWDAIKFGCLGVGIALARAWSLIRPASKEVWS